MLAVIPCIVETLRIAVSYEIIVVRGPVLWAAVVVGAFVVPGAVVV